MKMLDSQQSISAERDKTEAMKWILAVFSIFII